MGIFNFDSTNSNYSFLDSFESPELTLNNLTLKEALFKSVEPLDVIPRLVLVNGSLELELDYVNKLRNLIDEELDTIGMFQNQDNDEYATEMQSVLLNATNLSDTNEGSEVYPSDGGYISLRGSDFYFNFVNSYIELPKRISKIDAVYLKVKDLKVQNTSTSTIYFDGSAKYVYYANVASFPTSGVVGIFYVAISDTVAETVYEWNDGTSTYVANGTVASDITPKVRFLPNYTTLISVNTTGRANDIHIDMDTDTVYGYDTTYYTLNNIDSKGDVIADVTDRVVEKNVYDSRDVDVTTNSNNRYDETYELQANSLYYEYRNNKIFTGNTIGLWDTTTSLSIVMAIGFFNALVDDGIIPSGVDITNVLFFNYDETKSEVLAQVHYTPIPVSIRVSIDREDTTDINRYSEILNNQGQRIIELSNVLDNMYGRINKVGNSDLTIEQRVTDPSDLFDVGDYTSDGFVVTNIELVYYKDYIYAKYELTRNYNRLSKFLGVQSEVRQYEMGEQNTLERKLTYSEYVEYGAYNNASVPTAKDSIILLQDYGKECFLSTLDTTTTYPTVGGGMIKTDQSDYILSQFSSNGGGKSLVFEMQLPNNKNAGDYLVKESTNWTQAVSRKGRNYEPYTDTDGLFTSLKIFLFDKLDYGVTEQEIISDSMPKANVNWINNTIIKNDGSFIVLKDSREEIGFTYTIKMVSDDYNTVSIGDKFARRNTLVSRSAPSSLKLYVYDEEVFDRAVTKKAPTSGTLNVNYAIKTSPNVSVDYTNYKFTVTDTTLSTQIGTTGNIPKSWCITDGDDNILISVNQGDSVLDTILFNFVNKRSDINYNY